jgi:hypothetical protein
MGADNHPTVVPSNAEAQSANIPSVNGHALADLEGVEAAFAYLAKDYNDGDISRDLAGERVLVTARARRFQHLDHLLDAHASRDTPVRVADVYATHDGRQRVEVAVEEPAE